jgi:hypothetical protein
MYPTTNKTNVFGNLILLMSVVQQDVAKTSKPEVFEESDSLEALLKIFRGTWNIGYKIIQIKEVVL